MGTLYGVVHECHGQVRALQWQVSARAQLECGRGKRAFLDGQDLAAFAACTGHVNLYVAACCRQQVHRTVASRVLLHVVVIVVVSCV